MKSHAFRFQKRSHTTYKKFTSFPIFKNRVSQLPNSYSIVLIVIMKTNTRKKKHKDLTWSINNVLATSTKTKRIDIINVKREKQVQNNKD